MRKPVRVDVKLSKWLNDALADYRIEVPKGYTLYVTNTQCGRHCKKNKNITVPTWAVELPDFAKDTHCSDKEYAIYYACHEIAHILSAKSRVRGVMHSPQFYVEFKRICPARLQYFEINYKPALAAAAGIRSNN